MKRILSVIAFLCLMATSAVAGTIPISGTIRLANGNLMNGKIRFMLSYSAARDSCSSNLVVAQMVEFTVANGVLPASARITGNDCLQPANTFYTAQYVSSAGTVMAQNVFYVQGSSFDIGAATPTPLTTSNISFGSFVGLNEVASLNIDNIRMCDQFPGSTAGAQIAACIANLPSTGGIADARGIEGSQAITADPFFGVTKRVTLLLGSATYTEAVEINPTADYTQILCSGTTLQAVSAINIVHWSLSHGVIRDCALNGGNVAGTTGLRISPPSETQTTTLYNQDYNYFDNVAVKGTDNAIVLRTGPTVGGVDSDNSYNVFNHPVLQDNLRSYWFINHPSATAGWASPDANFTYGLTVQSSTARPNTGVQIDAGSLEQFIGGKIIGMANGAVPQNPPIAMYVAGSAPGSGSDNQFNRFDNIDVEGSTKCITVSSSAGIANYFQVAGGAVCPTSAISDSGTSTVIHVYPNYDQNGIWYKYTDASGKVTFNPADGVDIIPVTGGVNIIPVAGGATIAPAAGGINLTTNATTGMTFTCNVPSGSLCDYHIIPPGANEFRILKSSAPGANDPALEIDNGLAGGTKVYLTTSDGNTTASGSSNYSGGHQTAPGTWPGNFPTCNSGTAGLMFPISNSNVSTFNATITGTGSNKGIAYCDGTNWVFH